MVSSVLYIYMYLLRTTKKRCYACNGVFFFTFVFTLYLFKMPRLDIVAQQNQLYPYSGISFGEREKRKRKKDKWGGGGGQFICSYCGTIGTWNSLDCSLNLKRLMLSFCSGLSLRWCARSVDSVNVCFFWSLNRLFTFLSTLFDWFSGEARQMSSSSFIIELKKGYFIKKTFVPFFFRPHGNCLSKVLTAEQHILGKLQRLAKVFRILHPVSRWRRALQQMVGRQQRGEATVLKRRQTECRLGDIAYLHRPWLSCVIIESKPWEGELLPSAAIITGDLEIRLEFLQPVFGVSNTGSVLGACQSQLKLKFRDVWSLRHRMRENIKFLFFRKNDGWSLPVHLYKYLKRTH